MKEIKIGILGNPNSGKTSLFNALVGARQHVGNWPGVTVEKKSGFYLFNEKKYEVVDLPGIYSLSAASIDEKVARDFILQDTVHLIVNILDASNLERHLYLTVQLLEMRIPCLVVLNMMDRVKQKKIQIKIEKLGQMLDCPVVCTIASKGDGIKELKRIIQEIALIKKVSGANIYFPDEIEKGISRVSSLLTSVKTPGPYDPRWVAIKILEGDDDFIVLEHKDALESLATETRAKAKNILGEDIDILIADSRYGFVHSICKTVVDRHDLVRRDVSDIVDRVALNRYFGIPIFLLAMYFTFWITINFGGCFINFFDILFGAIFVDGLGGMLSAIGAPVFLKTLFADGLGGGIQTVSTFIPPIFFMFLCLSFLEDSGYMARAAFVMDGLMRKVGLPGKAFVPMLIGFGCNVPAIMATRTLGNSRDRTLAVVMNPFMSCGARLPVYAFFTAAFFPQAGGSIIFSLYLIGIFFAVLTAFLLKHTALKGEPSSFIMELPPYHMPTARGVLLHSWERLKGFIVKAGKAILAVIVILTLLNSFGGKDNTESFLSKAGQKAVVIFKPMGLTENNWPAAVGIFTGIFAKESVVGTLDSLYTQLDNKESFQQKNDFSFLEKVGQAFFSVGQSFSHLRGPFSFFRPQGPAKESRVSENIQQSMTHRFDGKVGAFAYLLLILLYMPCVATIAAVYQELNLKWAIFSVIYFSGVAWCASTVFYQTARFADNPMSAVSWIGFVLILFGLTYIWLKKQGHYLISE